AAPEDEQVVLQLVHLNDLGAVAAPALSAAAGSLIPGDDDRAAQEQDPQHGAPSARTFHDALLKNGSLVLEAVISISITNYGNAGLPANRLDSPQVPVCAEGSTIGR